MIGGFKNADNIWAWSDGTQWSYEAWKNGQPSDDIGNEKYLELINPVHGSWNDVPSIYPSKHGYICQYQL